MAYDKRRIKKSQYVLGVKPSTLDAPIAAQAGDFDPAPKYEYSSDGKTVTWTNRDRMPKVAAQAGDEPMRQALQVCVKALEFRKERSANDEFALNLARIALAESPRATADVERDSKRLDVLIAMAPNSFELIDQKWHLLNPRGRIAGKGETKRDAIDAAIATTKPGA